MRLDLRRAEDGLFASASLTVHLVRGAIAALLLSLAVLGEGSHPLASLAAGVAALVALRGCPVCWTIGLSKRSRQRSTLGEGVSHVALLGPALEIEGKRRDPSCRNDHFVSDHVAGAMWRGGLCRFRTIIPGTNEKSDVVHTIPVS